MYYRLISREQSPTRRLVWDRGLHVILIMVDKILKIFLYSLKNIKDDKHYNMENQWLKPRKNSISDAYELGAKLNESSNRN